MGFSYIEEDFRFATAMQVDRYTTADRGEKPNMPGLAFAQLLDQLNGQRLQRPDNRFYIRAPSGTAVWIARHWQELETPPQLHLSIESQGANSQVVQQLHTIPGVCQVDVNEELPALSACRNVTCATLVCSYDLESWRRRIEAHPVLQFRPVLIYDRHRTLRTAPGGVYFMNSSIWVNRRYGH